MAYKVRQNLSPFFTSGREGSRVSEITIHHAATTDFDGIGRTFKTRGVSAHYGVGRSKNVNQYVGEGNIAYHAGNWNANKRSIGIEHVNSSGAPNWDVAQETFLTSVELARDIVKRHGLGKLVPFQNLFPHDYYSATACPAKLKARLQEYANAVNTGVSAPSKPAPAPAKPSTSKKSNQTIANEVINGKWGNNPQRAENLKKAGYDPATIQALVNKYYGIGTSTPTAQSYSSVAQQVINGAWGNGDDRKRNLAKAGYDYAKVQSEVNRILGVGSGRAVPSGGVFAVGQNVQVTNPVAYDGTRLGTSGTYKVMEVKGDRIVIGRGGVVTAAIKNSNLRKV